MPRTAVVCPWLSVAGVVGYGYGRCGGVGRCAAAVITGEALYITAPSRTSLNLA